MLENTSEMPAARLVVAPTACAAADAVSAPRFFPVFAARTTARGTARTWPRGPQPTSLTRRATGNWLFPPNQAGVTTNATTG